jgi:hypothetical protein
MAIGNPISFVTSATRHMLDANVTFGMASDRYNARDQYRREYTDTERLGAGVGTALGVAIPVTAGLAWAQRGLKVPGISNHSQVIVDGLAKAAPRGMGASAMQMTGRAVGIAALGVAAGVGVMKTVQISKDDGHLGAAGTAGGILAGATAGIWAGQKFAGKYAPLVSLAGGIAGGIAGNLGGRAVKIGESQIGKEHVQVPQVDDGAVDRVGSFARGAVNHFVETGPATQGVSFGNSWGMNETVREKYSNSERAGAMHGDLLAVGILGAGAVGIAGGLLGQSIHAAKGVGAIRAGGDIAGTVLAKGALTNMTQQLGTKGAVGLGAAAVGIAGLTGWKAYQSDKSTWGGTAAAVIGAGTIAATAGSAALISRSSAFQGMSGGLRAANSMLAAAAIIGVLSAARLPAQQFMSDAKAAAAARPEVDTPVMLGATGIGVAAGGFGAFKGLSKMIPDGFQFKLGPVTVNKTAAVLAGTAVGLVAGGAVGNGLSATMPDAKTVGMSVAGGAVAGAALGGFARGIGVLPGIIGGAALGLTASSLLHDDTPAAEAATPQEAAGTVGG